MRAEALDVCIAVSGKLFDGGVQDRLQQKERPPKRATSNEPAQLARLRVGGLPSKFKELITRNSRSKIVCHVVGRYQPLRPKYGTATLVRVNDIRGHAAVLALFDEVIAEQR